MSDIPPSTKKPDLKIIEGGDDRPEIKLTRESRDIADRAAEVISLDKSIYRRAGSLVHVVKQDATIPGGRSTLSIRELPHALLVVHLNQIARWIKFDAKAQAYKRVDAPSPIVNAVHARGQWPDVRPLLAVVNAPTLRRDGSVIQKKGYDADSGILYHPSRSFAEAIESPTEEDARAAANHILDYACDFPFATDSDRSAWLTTVLTLVARNMIEGTCPLFAIDGNTPGVGKSRLVDLAHVIAYGTKAPRSPLSLVPEEMRKQITSLLIEGVACVLIDNVDSRFGGPVFDALLTSDVWRDRELGRLAVRTLPSRAVWFASGNNIQLIGDLVRRAIVIRLQTDLTHPELRAKFRWGEGDKLFKAADRARVLLVPHAITIIRAYQNAGRPMRNLPSWGSYESWVRTVVDPIRWLGFADPLNCRAQSHDAGGDSGMLAAEAVAAALRDVGRALSVRELLSQLYPPQRFDGDGTNDLYPSFGPAREMLESVTNARGMPDLVRVGHFLRRFRDRRLSDGSRLVGDLDNHAKIVRWGVKEAENKGGPTSSSPVRA